MPKKSLKKNIIPEFKKDIKAFLSSEEGSVNKKDIAKIALSVIAIGLSVSGAMKPDATQAQCSHASHGSHASHANHSNHSSY